MCILGNVIFNVCLESIKKYNCLFREYQKVELFAQRISKSRSLCLESIKMQNSLSREYQKKALFVKRVSKSRSLSLLTMYFISAAFCLDLSKLCVSWISPLYLSILTRTEQTWDRSKQKQNVSCAKMLVKSELCIFHGSEI